MLAGLVWFCLGIQVFHYAGYPLLLAALARLRPRPPRQAPVTPKVSLIVSAYNEAAVIGEKIENSLDLDYPDLEIIVNSEGSSDATATIVAGFANRGVIGMGGTARRGKGAALSAAAARAGGEILVFSDANAFYRADAVQKLVANFADPEVGCVSGKKTVLPAGGGKAGNASQSEGLYWRYENLIKRLESRTASAAGTVGEMMAVRSALFAPLPGGIINDDAYLALRTQKQCYRVIYESEAVCWENSSASLAEDAMRRSRITAGRYQLLSRPDLWPWNQPLALLMLLAHKMLRLLLPLFMIGAILFNILAVVLPADPAPGMTLTLAAQGLFYGLALAGMVAEQSGWSWRPAKLALYLTASNLSSLVGLWRHLGGRQTVLWEKIAR
jgi:cellulose synthase/poly-beta-1,6-N-acetylglucosamine synthase-like glycosyltransferase